MTTDTLINLTQEEIKYLSTFSPCLSCNHKSTFHENNQNAVKAECNIPNCNCESLILEGDICYWSIDRYRYGDVYAKANKILSALFKDILDTKPSLPPSFFPINKDSTMRIIRHNRFTLPETITLKKS